MRKTPGPVGKSCITCKQRRKKCDRRQPACKRCETGDFECLGYPEEPPEEQGQAEDTRPCPQLRPLLPIPPTGIAIDEHPHLPLGFPSPPYPELNEGGSLQASARGFDGCPYAPPNTLPAVSIHDQNTAQSYSSVRGDASLEYSADWGSKTLLATSLTLPGFLSTITPAPYATDVYPQSRALPKSSNTAAPSLPDTWHPMNARIMSYMNTLPRGLPPLPTDVAKMANFVLTQYDRLFSLSYFDPMLHGALSIRTSVTQRVFASNATRCILLLGARIIESFLDGTLTAKSSQYNDWIKRLEEQLGSSTENLTFNEAETRAIDTLQLSFYKARITDQFDPHELLRKSASVFLQLVFSDPTLWPNVDISPLVSLPYVLASNRHELDHFIMVDILCSTTYGLPQMIEYDTSGSLPVFDRHIHGFPMEFHIVLADINTRFQKSLVYDWQSVEQRILAWQSPVCATSDQESWKRVSQLAVLESWRQTLLIYLYMTMCNVTSDDPRVQSSVRQVFQLIDSAQSSHAPSIGYHFTIQCLIAGACARSERQRTLARDGLSDTTQSRMWILRGSDFVPVLDHLWHGAAANGHPIRWSDYLASRQVVLPTAM